MSDVAAGIFLTFLLVASVPREHREEGRGVNIHSWREPLPKEAVAHYVVGTLDVALALYPDVSEDLLKKALYDYFQSKDSDRSNGLYLNQREFLEDETIQFEYRLQRQYDLFYENNFREERFKILGERINVAQERHDGAVSRGIILSPTSYEDLIQATEKEYIQNRRAQLIAEDFSDIPDDDLNSIFIEERTKFLNIEDRLLQGKPNELLKTTIDRICLKKSAKWDKILSRGSCVRSHELGERIATFQAHISPRQGL